MIEKYSATEIAITSTAQRVIPLFALKKQKEMLTAKLAEVNAQIQAAESLGVVEKVVVSAPVEEDII